MAYLAYVRKRYKFRGTPGVLALDTGRDTRGEAKAVSAMTWVWVVEGGRGGGRGSVGGL